MLQNNEIYKFIQPFLHIVTIGYGWWDILIFPIFAVYTEVGIFNSSEFLTIIVGLLFIRASYSWFVFLPYQGRLHSIKYALVEIITLSIVTYAIAVLVEEIFEKDLLYGAFGKEVFVYPRLTIVWLILIYAIVVQISNLIKKLLSGPG